MVVPIAFLLAAFLCLIGIVAVAIHEATSWAPLAGVCALACGIFSIVSMLSVHSHGVYAGHGTPLTQQDLKLSILYETVGDQVIQHTLTIANTPEYLVFLKTEEGYVKAYRLELNPPPRFIVVRNEQGEREFLSRPLTDKAPRDTKIEAASP